MTIFQPTLIFQEIIMISALSPFFCFKSRSSDNVNYPKIWTVCFPSYIILKPLVMVMKMLTTCI